MERFSRWFDGVKAAPDGTAVVQVKVLGELLDYPRGKSAMVWYGVVFECASHAMSGVLDEAVNRVPGRRLVWRFLKVEEPEAYLQQLLSQFQARFGAPPGQST